MKGEVVIALLDKSKHYCQLHKFKKSTECLEKAIKLVPELAILWYNKGVVFGMEADELVREQMQMQLSGETKEQDLQDSSRKYEEALECYDKAIELNPKDLKTWHNRGGILVELRDYHTAIECCDKEIKLGQTNWELVDPNDNDAWDPKGIAALAWLTKGTILYIYLGRYRASFDSVYGMNPSHHNEAIKCFDKAIELNPKDANVWRHKGNALVDLAEHGMKPSVFILEQFKDPEDAKKRIVMAQFNKYMEAAKCYEKVIKLDPVDENAWSILGDTCVKLWLVYLEIPSEDVPSSLMSFDTPLSNIKEQSWDEKAAREMYGDSEHSKSWDEREKIWEEKGDTIYVDIIHDKALECLEKVTDMDPWDSFAWTKLGCMVMTKDPNKAVECLRKAVKLLPENAIAWLIMATVHELWWENMEESAKCYSKAIELDPSYVDYTDTKGRIDELYKRIEKQQKKTTERLLSEKFVRFHYGNKEQQEKIEKQRRERKLSDDLAKIEEICQNCSLTKDVWKTALDFYQNLDEDFEQVEWKSASLLGAPRSYEILKTRKSEMLKKPPFAAAIVYIACEMCDTTHSIEEILQKISYPKKPKSKAIQDAKKYYDILLTDSTPAVLKIKQFESKEEYLDFMKKQNASSTNQVKKYPPELKKKS